MKVLASLFSFIVLCSAHVSDDGISNFIVNGRASVRGQFPHQALLLARFREFEQLGRCGGTLISKRFVLTAAHCVDGAISVDVHLGALYTNRTNEPGRIIRRTSVYHVHPRFMSIGFADDIALIDLKKPVQFTKTIQPARLPPTRETFNGINAYMSGFGLRNTSDRNFPEILQWAQFQIITNAECARRLGSNGRPVRNTNFICAAGAQGQSRCYGDSGSPLVTKDRVVIGIVGFGDPQNCHRGLPSVCTRVSNYLPWITNIIQ